VDIVTHNLINHNNKGQLCLIVTGGTSAVKLENVLLSPHCADHTADWQDQAMRFFLEQYGRFEEGASR
jgi:phosphoglycerate dehydrogenase-like enzyme